MNEITNMNTIQEKVRERIQTEFVSLIPKEAWDNLVANEIKWFMEDSGSGYNKHPAPLKSMVRTQLNEKFKEQIGKTLSDMEGSWSGITCKAKAGDAVKQMVKEIAPELWEIAVADIVQRAVDGLRQQITRI